MKAVLLTPSPVIKPKTRISETKDGNKSQCYFPRCRKDANCECEMCLASINATLDLMPMSAQRSSLTKLSASKPTLETTAVSSTPGSSTPVSRTRIIARLSGAKSSDSSKPKTKNRKSRIRSKFWNWVLLLGVVLAFEFGFSWGVCLVSRPALLEKMMRDVLDFSRVEGLSVRLNLVQKRLEGVLGGDRVSSCSLGESNWKIDQDGLIMHSYCIMYKSIAEEVIVRGWPLQTAGLLTAGFSSRSFSLLSGRLIEWPEGSMTYVVRDKNSTWVLRKYSASVVNFDANTWIIEYKKSLFLDDTSILLAALKFLNFRITKMVARIRQHLWLLPNLSNYAAYISEEGSSLPT